MSEFIVMVEAPNSDLGLRPWPKDADWLDGVQNATAAILSVLLPLLMICVLVSWLWL